MIPPPENPAPDSGRNLTSSVTDRLTEEIVAGKLTPGTRLPTERALMESYGVSRTVVREAIAALRADGLVETRQGSGAFVARDLGKRPFRIDPVGLGSIGRVFEVMELRLCVEVEAAGLAAERRTKTDLANLRRINRAMGKAVSKGDPAIELDFNLHNTIGAATGNPYFSSFLEFIGRIIIPRRTILIEEIGSADQYQPFLARIHDDHDRIIAAIAEQNVMAARQAMRSHLVEGLQRFRNLIDEGQSEA